MRIAVFGAGGVGGYFGGRLAQAGEPVVFIARGAHLAALRERGLRVDSVAGDFTLSPPVEATDDPASAGTVDAVLVCVKAWQVPEAARALVPMLRDDSFVVPLENGVEAADQLGAQVGAARVLGGLCRIVSFVAGPGHIRHAGALPRVEFGERDGRPSPRVGLLRAAFERCAGVSVGTPPDIEEALWEKFLFIAPFSAVAALTRLPAGVVRGVPETRRLLEDAIREVLAVARRRGVALPDEAVARTLAYVDGLPEDATASMQRDILEGRRSELDAQTGTIVRLGREMGVSVPVSEFLYACLLPLELLARGRAG
ncbi:MAG TPA: 2-dehydropantoate 2-reductase [Vicinamibacteria bacterium]|nr:2-dehydropantoate 2-reductase [Vicinamibacteria bacterium]